MNCLTEQWFAPLLWVLRECSLSQVVDGLTRFRVGQVSSLLYLAFLQNTSLLISHQIVSPLGKSNHASLFCYFFTYYCSLDSTGLALS